LTGSARATLKTLQDADHSFHVPARVARRCQRADLERRRRPSRSCAKRR